MNEEYLNYEIGRRIHNRRKECGITMRELGELVGKHESTIKKYEDGKIKRYNIELIQEIAKVLKVESEYLLCLDLRQGYDIVIKNPDDKKILDMIHRLTPSQQEAIYTIIANMTRE